MDKKVRFCTWKTKIETDFMLLKTKICDTKVINISFKNVHAINSIVQKWNKTKTELCVIRCCKIYKEKANNHT